MMRLKTHLFLGIFVLALSNPVANAKELLAIKTSTEPVIDGLASEAIWEKATPLSVYDTIADINITLKAAYNKDKIFILATFKDADENREHRTLIWDNQLKAYQNGPEREDVFVLKWSMTDHPTQLTLQDDAPYFADIWFWKAMRTDHAGYADDKMHIYTASKSKKSKAMVSKKGRIFYLTRKGDAGKAAYSSNLVRGMQGDRIRKYNWNMPEGSRADIRAKGVWQNGSWTIEFGRKLNTGNGDDIQFEVGQKYPFGVSRYEIAGRSPEPMSQQPLYGVGEVGEIIMLLFK